MNQTNPGSKVVHAICIIVFILASFLFSSCGSNKSETATSEHDALPEEKNRVETLQEIRIKHYWDAIDEEG